MSSCRSCRNGPGPFPRKARGWIALLLLAAFVAATSSERAHRAAVLHAVCVEHGELVHVEARVAARAALACASPGAEAPSAQPLETDGAGHEHCHLGPLQRERVLQPGGAPTLARPAPPAAMARAVAAIDPPRAEALLLLAPKQSPPVQG